MTGKEYYRLNREKAKEYSRQYRKEHPEWKKEDNKRFHQKNPHYWNLYFRLFPEKRFQKRHSEKWNHYRREKRSKDICFQLSSNVATAIWRALKEKKAMCHWENLVGYTLHDLMGHLEKQFDSKMNWKNYGNYWVIDHIRPQSLFWFKSTNDLQFKKCWELKNLQPLERRENEQKSNSF